MALSSTSPLLARWRLAVTESTLGRPRIHSAWSSIWKPRSSTTPPPDSRFCRRHSSESQWVRWRSQPALTKKISPRSPFSTNLRSSCASGRKRCCTEHISVRSAFFAALTMAAASSALRASGRSQKTCLPASSAATAMGACRKFGVQRSTTSTSSSESSSSSRE